MTHSIYYLEIIRRRGPFGLSLALPKLRAAHVDERVWRRLKGRPFTVQTLMLPGAAE